MKGAAIFATSLLECIWQETEPFYNFSTALRWNKKFNYFENFLLYEGALEPVQGHAIDIATDTYIFDVDNSAAAIKVNDF